MNDHMTETYEHAANREETESCKKRDKRPLITIGIASYNYQNYIERALKAIKRQKFTDYEVLISDDCSEDDSVKVIRSFMESNPQMQIRLMVSSENKGIVANKNILIENCGGEYLMICDSDDWMADNCLEKIAEVIEKERPDRIIAAVSDIDETGKIIQVQDVPQKQTKWGWSIHHASAYRVDIIRQHNILIKDRPDDLYFTIEFAKYCKKMSSIQEPIYFWFVHFGSAGRKEKPFASVCPQHLRTLNYLGQTAEFLRAEPEYTSRDVEELRMVLLKFYYFYIFFGLQKHPLKEKLYYYKIFHNEVLKIDPDYLKNDFLKNGAEPILRAYALKSIKLFVALERTKLMKMAIVFYHIVSRFKYFDQ